MTNEEQERHEYATQLAASSISNDEFHKALAEYDRSEMHEETPLKTFHRITFTVEFETTHSELPVALIPHTREKIRQTLDGFTPVDYETIQVTSKKVL